MKIRFQFDLDKAIEAMSFIVGALGAIEKVKLLKLLYIADREHFLAYGHPITGDRLSAMRWGPLPSACLDALNGQSWPVADKAFEYIHVSDNTVTRKRDPGVGLLSETEILVLREVLTVHGHKERWKLVGETHRFPEYVECYEDGTSKTIPYELLLKHSGRQDSYQWNRPIISPATLEHMIRPFPQSEPNL